MIRAALISFCLLILLCSYQKPDCLLLSFKNASNQDFIKLEVYTYDGMQIFYNLKKGQTTNPVAVSKSYKFTYAKAYTPTDTIVTPGFCRTGEKLFTNGSIAMSFTINAAAGHPNKYLLINADVNEAATDPGQL